VRGGKEVSVTVTTGEKVPAAIGVPLITPALFTFSPPGNPDAVQLYGGCPPEAVRVVWG